MRGIISTILIIVLTLPFGLKMGIVTHYWANLSYYATELCENTNKPELQCNGNCQVTKELSKTESNPKSPISITVKEINLFTVNDFSIDTEITFSTDRKDFGLLPNHYIFNISQDFFHPPEHYRFS